MEITFCKRHIICDVYNLQYQCNIVAALWNNYRISPTYRSRNIDADFCFYNSNNEVLVEVSNNSYANDPSIYNVYYTALVTKAKTC